MHVGTVQLEGRKMAKSTGNLVFVSDLVQRTSPAVVRMMLLDRRYDAAWDYDDGQLETAGQRLDALRIAAGRPHDDEVASQKVLAALADDLDVRGALDVALEEGGQAARDALQVLGLQLR